MERAVKLAAGAERPLLAPFTQLLPPAAGPAVLSVLGLGRDVLARLQLAAAAVARIDSCGPQLDGILRKGAAAEALALLASLAPLIAADPAAAVRPLGAALASTSREVRVAAAQALSTCAGEPAANVLLDAMAQAQFDRADQEEQTIFYRSLGKLGSNAGHIFLLDRLERPRKKLFKRRKAIDDQLLAVQGLAEEGSVRSLRALEEAQQASRAHPPEVVAACRTASLHARAALKAGRIA
jgi:hypothetical protein